MDFKVKFWKMFRNQTCISMGWTERQALVTLLRKLDCISWYRFLHNRDNWFICLLGISQVFNGSFLACTSFWEDVVWSGTTGCPVCWWVPGKKNSVSKPFLDEIKKNKQTKKRSSAWGLMKSYEDFPGVLGNRKTWSLISRDKRYIVRLIWGQRKLWWKI